MKTVFPLIIKMTMDKRSKDAPFVAYASEVDVASCGSTEEKARQNLHEAVEIVLEEAERKGKLPELLEDLGFQKEEQGWIPPKVIFEPFFFPKLKFT